MSEQTMKTLELKAIEEESLTWQEQAIIKLEGELQEEVFEAIYEGIMSLYCPELDLWYNYFGQQLRDQSEYNTASEGYTPFGDE